MKLTNEQVYVTVDALLKALCPYEEIDTPQVSAAINSGMRLRDAVKEAIEQQPKGSDNEN